MPRPQNDQTMYNDENFITSSVYYPATHVTGSKIQISQSALSVNQLSSFIVDQSYQMLGSSTQATPTLQQSINLQVPPKKYRYVK